MEVAVIFIALFASAFGIFYIHLVTRNKERMALIDQGASPELFKTKRDPRERRSGSNSVKFTLKFGLFLTGIGLGFLVSVFIEPMFTKEIWPLAVTGVVFIFGGIGLVVGYFLGLRIDKQAIS